ncbi:Glycosyltransferase involved in cell wall bisynthesis [Lentzea albidocapillata subsp. violacea]|uniref:Glycosyltransferase involved in cell wall bisynthesis n=1 Tax=Lentzea albidocapillata subsp. violacea TaxID=128104 RepID=A0A1G8SJ90_9PSEU|nr:glycosyltransferase family 4 protein [Lentzea albidocapillata]SDJ28700.1 Glycosyltransferase involved in cell wall bisynthesis [Lentzea albidocapillata subsp. violacea]
MRVVMVSTGAPPDPLGGIGTYVEGLLGGLASRDAEVHLVGASRHRGLPPESGDGRVTVHRVPTGQPRTRLGMAIALARLNLAGIRYVVRRRPDVVAVHDWMCAPAGLVCALLLRLPVCFHVHSAEIFRGEGGRGAVAYAGRLLTRVMSRWARLVVVPSPDTVAAVPCLAGNAVVVSHGAGKAWRMPCPDAAEREVVRKDVRARYGLPDGQRLVVFAGRYAAHKGVTELVEAIGRIPDVTLVLAGSGWPEIGPDERLHRLVARLGLRDRVHVLGRFLGTGELRDHLVAADVCAFPSAYEPFGFVALEAMALRARTVVGPGFDEAVVGSGEGTCLRTTTMSVDELAAAVRRALSADDPELGDRARRYVLDHHSWEAAADRTLRVYAEAVRR